MKHVSAAMAAIIVVGCTIDRSGEAEVGAATSSTGGGSAVGPGTTVASATTSAGVGGGDGRGCYSEAYQPNVSLADLQSSYQGTQWLAAMLETLDRRYDNGWYVLDAMKTDPWLTGSFPSYFELGTFAGMIESLDTACHEETHGYDFEQALSLPGEHLYYMGPNLEVIAPKLDFFERNAIVPVVTQGGSVTAMYDDTYLTGSQGSYDFIFLADELTAYINGLACATSVGDHIVGGHSYRDGAASHLYYMQAYLKVARAQHASLYDSWRANAAWQKFVRYSWARGHFWTEAAMAHPGLGINDAAIWARIEDPANLEEIELFTGDDPAVVACHPEG